METLLVFIFVILNLMACLAYPEDDTHGPQLINGQGHKVKFRETKPVPLTLPKKLHFESGEYNLIKDDINGPQLINGQGQKVRFRERKPVLLAIPKTINLESGEYNFTNEDQQFLRRKKLPEVITCLYYYETDDYGYEVYSKWLHSLRDVAKLFINRFNIDIEYYM